MSSVGANELRAGGSNGRPGLSLVTPASAQRRSQEQTYELQFTFAELTLIYRSLQATKKLGALPPQDERLNDTLELVDQALKKAV
jgi:hypothetical protein